MKTQNLFIYTALSSLMIVSMNANAGMASAPPAPATPTSSTTTECTTDFKTASEYFQKILGVDASLAKVASFNADYSGGGLNINTENSFKDGGGPIYLEVKLSMMKMPISAPVHAPVRICKTNGKLTASAIMSNAVIKAPKGDKPVKELTKNLPSGIVVPNEVVYVVTRAPNKGVIFTNETIPNQKPSTALVLQ